MRDRPRETTIDQPDPSSKREATSLERSARALAPWFHNLHLPHGVQTAPDHPLGDFPAFKWRQIAPHLPQDLSGWRALDIGCNAGFYSFELARRGADVLGIDLDPHYLAQARWARDQLGLQERVRFRRLQVYELERLGERFDLVLFMGVLYHLRYPLLGLDTVAQVVDRLLVFQSLTMPGELGPERPELPDLNAREALLEPDWPKLAFLEHGAVHDPTNWWAPNASAVEAMLRSCGLRVTARPGHEILLCEPDGEREPVAAGWNRAEYLAATGRTWHDEADGEDAAET